MPKKHNTQSFIEKASIKHKFRWDYSKVNYVNNHTKVEIGCPKHGSYLTTPDSHLQGRGRCPKCVGGVSYTLETFIEKATEVHQSTYDYSEIVEYKNSTTPVPIRCPIHGNFLQKPCVHLRGNGCPKCGIDKRSKKQRLSPEKFVSRASHKFPDYDFSKFKYITAKIRVLLYVPYTVSLKQHPIVYLVDMVVSSVQVTIHQQHQNI